MDRVFECLNCRGLACQEILKEIAESSKNNKGVYFITDGEYVKIGVSSCFVSRLKAIQTGNPKRLYLYAKNNCTMNMARDMELKLHKMFSEYRTVGEWFIFSDEVKDYIDKNMEVV